MRKGIKELLTGIFMFFFILGLYVLLISLGSCASTSGSVPSDDVISVDSVLVMEPEKDYTSVLYEYLTAEYGFEDNWPEDLSRAFTRMEEHSTSSDVRIGYPEASLYKMINDSFDGSCE